MVRRVWLPSSVVFSDVALEGVVVHDEGGLDRTFMALVAVCAVLAVVILLLALLRCCGEAPSLLEGVLGV